MSRYTNVLFMQLANSIQYFRPKFQISLVDPILGYMTENKRQILEEVDGRNEPCNLGFMFSNFDYVKR